MSREQVRFKIWYNYSDKLAELLNEKPIYKCYKTKFKELSAYSKWSYTDLLNKENRARLYQMMDASFPFDTFVKGVGYKTVHHKAKKNDPNPEAIYIIDGVRNRKPMKVSDNEDRETMLLRRVNMEKLSNNWWGRTWNSRTLQYEPVPVEEAFRSYMQNQDANAVFVDRVTKKEREKLMMINLLDPGVYLEGFGGYKITRVYNYVLRKYEETEQRQYFIEV